jgi:RHS repeat-associated protein
VGSTQTPVEFTGKERDAETGLDYFGARYMSSAQGRFTSPDKPFADQHPEDPQSWNLYGYVRNNPLKFIDVQGNAAQKPVPGANGYTYRPDLNNQNDNPNFHIFDRKGREIGRISVQEVRTGEVNAAGDPLTERGVVVTEGKIPNAVMEGVQGIVEEKGILPRFSISGGAFEGFAMNALGVLPVLSGAAVMAVDTYRSGIGMNMAPWNYGSMYIFDPNKAAATLGNGAYINFTDQKGSTTMYQVQNGKFIQSGCQSTGNNCELKNTSGGTFQVVKGQMN